MQDAIEAFCKLIILEEMVLIGFIVMLVSIGIAILGRVGMSVLMPLTVCFGMVFTIYPEAMARAQDNIEKEEIVPVSAAFVEKTNVDMPSSCRVKAAKKKLREFNEWFGLAP